MKGFIGDSVIKDLENRRNQVEQNMITEGEISSADKVKRSVPATRLISDPTTKVNVPKTLDNVEAVVWHTFENPKAPMYHVRKMLGNTKNVIMSAAKIPPNNVLVPSQYEVAKVTENNGDERLGAINQKMLSTRGSFGDVKETSELAPGNSFGVTDTLQKIGGVVRESVNSGKNIMVHANDAATDARNVLYSVKHAAPRLIVPEVPTIASRTFDFNVNPTARKAVIITPKLLDVQENVVGVGADEDQNTQFVGMGNILDAVGLIKPNPPEVEMEKIVLEPSAVDVMKQWDMPRELRSSSAVKTWMMDNLKNDQYSRKQDTLGAAEPERPTGTKTFKEFFNKMHQEMKEILASQHEERKKKRKQMTRKPKTKPNYVNTKKDLKAPKKKPIRKTVVPVESPVQKIDGILGAPINRINTNTGTVGSSPTLPPDILDIFADKNSYGSNQRNSDLSIVNSGTYDVDTNKIEAQKTIPNSKIVNDHIPSTETKQKNPQSIDNADNETVALFLTPELLKPFMGQPPEDVVHNYLRENGDDIPSEERTSNSGKPLDNMTVYPINPLDKNITIPLSEHGEPLFNLTSLIPNADVSGGTDNLKNALAEADTYKTPNMKFNAESTAHFRGNLTPQGRDFTRSVNHGDDLGHILGAINPMMFERYFNESLKFRHSNVEATSHNPVLGDINPTRLPTFEQPNTDYSKLKDNILHQNSVGADANQKQHISPTSESGQEQQISQKVDVENSNETGRTSMKIIDIYQKPFMGYITQKKIRGFLNKYNNNLADSSEEATGKIPHQKENNNAVKNIIYSDYYDFDPYM